MSNKPTIKTIAEMAGVSHVAVSKALRGHPDISKETTARIQKIANDVGYIPTLLLEIYLLIVQQQLE